MEEKEICNGEKLTNIVRLNNAKHSLLNEIKKLDMAGLLESKEAAMYIGLFKDACGYYYRDLCEVENVIPELAILLDDLNNKNDVLELLDDKNNNRKKDFNILNMIRDDKKTLHINKTLLDFDIDGLLGFHILEKKDGYNEFREKFLNNLRNYCGNDVSIVELGSYQSLFGSRYKFDFKKVDNLMVRDLWNMFFYLIEKDISICTDEKKKEELYKYKYNLIYLFDFIELRAINTNFSFPDYPKLSSEEDLMEVNIDYDDYAKIFDSALSKILENNVKVYLALEARGIKSSMDDLGLLFIRACAELIYDKELLESLVTNINMLSSDVSKETKEKVEEINKIYTDIRKKDNSKLLRIRLNSII